MLSRNTTTTTAKQNPTTNNDATNTTLPLFDVDINLTHPSLSIQIPTLLQHAYEKSNIVAGFIPGSNLSDSKMAIEICKQYSRTSTSTSSKNKIQLFSSIGIHPYYAQQEPKSSLTELETLLLLSLKNNIGRKEIVVAIGECGLDTSPSFPRLEDQIFWMEEQVQLAVKLQLPLFLHERNAHEPFIRILRRFGTSLPKCLVHCFTGSEYELKTYLDAGFYISISGMICKQSSLGANLRNVLIKCNPPPHRLLIETDSPYMGFPGCRHGLEIDSNKEFPNVPSSLPMIVDVLSKILNRSVDDVMRDTFKASCEFFGV
jgi:TatD DNase family protein